jgi:hypothetical protein
MERTPKPTIDFLSVYPGCTSITGYVGSVDEVGNYIPEAKSYVYVYLDGILVNEKYDPNDPDGELFTVGTERDISSIVLDERYGVYTVTDAAGKWSWTVPAGYIIETGQRLVVRAQTAGKMQSEYSEQHTVFSTPVPKNIVALGQDNTFDLPKNGDITIEGDLDGWISTSTGEQILPYIPDTRFPLERQEPEIYTYINGVRDGAVTKNSIATLKPVLDLFSFREGGTLAIYVQGEKVYLNFPNLGKMTYEETFTVNANNEKTFLLTKYSNIDVQNVIPIVSKNGLRLTEYIDYIITFDSLNILEAQITNVGDAITITYLPVDNLNSYVHTFYVGQAGLTEFYLAPCVKGDTLEEKYVNVSVYKNGLKLKYPTAYTPPLENTGVLNDTYDYTLVLDGQDCKVVLEDATEENDVVVIDFIKSTAVETSYTLDDFRLHTSQSDSAVFRFDSSSQNLLYINVFKNGLRLREKQTNVDGDYTVVRVAPSSMLYDITIHNITLNDLITLEYVYFNEPNDVIVKSLNEVADFINYRIVVKQEDGMIVLESPYTLEPDYDDVSFNTLLGGSVTLYPGKNEYGQFKTYFNASSGRWRYTYSRPLKRMEYINASTRATLTTVG